MAKEWHCLRCLYDWGTRVPHPKKWRPKQCPNCHTFEWWRPAGKKGWPKGKPWPAERRAAYDAKFGTPAKDRPAKPVG